MTSLWAAHTRTLWTHKHAHTRKRTPGYHTGGHWAANSHLVVQSATPGGPSAVCGMIEAGMHMYTHVHAQPKTRNAMGLGSSLCGLVWIRNSRARSGTRTPVSTENMKYAGDVLLKIDDASVEGKKPSAIAHLILGTLTPQPRAHGAERLPDVVACSLSAMLRMMAYLPCSGILSGSGTRSRAIKQTIHL